MTISTGHVTIMGGGATNVIAVTNDAYGVGLASSFQSISAQFASTGSGLYTYSPGSTFLAATNSQGLIAVQGASVSSILLVGDGDTLGYFGSTDATIVSGDGNDTILSGAGSDTIAAGSGNNVILLQSGSNELVESSGNDSIQAGQGADTVNVDSAGTSSIYGGTGLLTVNAYGHATVYGGDRTLIYAASGGSVILDASSHNNGLVANSSSPSGQAPTGNVTLDGAAAGGGNQFWAGSGNASLVGGMGDDTLVGAQGNATLVGGGGNNDFDFFANQGGASTNVTITDFGLSSGNIINLFNYGSSGFQYALSHMSTSAAGTQLTLNDGSKILLQGYSGTLNSSNVKYN